VSNAGFRRCLKTVGGERFALIPTRSSRSGSSTASLCRTQHRPQPLGSCSVAKRLWMGEQTFRTAKHPSSTRPIFHNNQPVVGVDRDLNVVADVDLRMRGHTQAAPASPCKVCASRAGSRLFRGSWFARHSRHARGVPPIQPLEIVVQPLVGVRDELPQRTTDVIAVLIFDCLMRVASTASSTRSKRSSRRHRSTNWRNTARNAARLWMRPVNVVASLIHHLARR
jgi:hypothetical protein